MTRLGNALAAALGCIGLATLPAASQDRAAEQFNRRVEAYMEFRSDFTEMVPPLHVSGDPRLIEAASDGLAAALRAARPGARVGDIFTPDIAAAFRQRLQDALWQQSSAAAEVLREIDREAPNRPPHLAVNERFDWKYGAAMPGCFIAALPPLPEALQYRFVGGDLVLVDVEARLVVDILPLALVVD